MSPLILSLALTHVGCDSSQDEEGSTGCEGLECQVETSSIDHAEVEQRLEVQTDQMMTDLQDRLEVINNDERLFDLVNMIFESEEEDCWGEWNEETQSDEERCETRIEGRVEALEIDLTESKDDVIDELKNMLSMDRLVADANELTYTLDLQELCTSNDEDEDDVEGEGEVETTIDAECMREIESLQPKARVRGADDGLQIELLLNADEKVVATFTIVSGRASLQLDLGQIIEIVDGIVSEEDLTLPSVSGKVSVSFDMSNANTLVLNIDEEIRVQGDLSDDLGLDLSIPAVQEMLSATLNTTLKSVQIAAQAPALEETIRTRLAYADEEEEGFEGDDEDRRTEDGPLRALKLLFGGGEIDLTVSLANLAQTELGFQLLGEGVQISADNKTLIHLEVNPQERARVEAMVDHSKAAQDEFVLSMRSAINRFVLSLDFSAVPEIEFPEEINDNYELTFNGASDALPSIQMSEENVQVVAGTLMLSAESAAVNFTAEAGQCIDIREDEEGEDTEDQHFLESLVSGMCE